MRRALLPIAYAVGWGVAILVVEDCTPAERQAADLALTVTRDACSELDPDGGAGDFVDVVCTAVDGRKARVRIPLAAWRTAKVYPRDGGP